MLEIRDLDVFYGNIHALYGVSLNVGQGEIVTLVGANGAGKTTLLRAISGVATPRGTIEFEGDPIAGDPPESIVRRGIVQVPEGRRIFPGLSVIENLEVAGYALRHPERTIRADLDRVLQTFPPLAARAKAYGWSLSGGEQQMLAIGRGLMARPRLLMLDEPSLGLAPMLIEEVFGVIAEIGAEGTPILLVEQNARKALGVADRGYVLENGEVVREGSATELLDDASIVAAYLGAD